MKKKWGKPKLIVLVRKSQAESVLTGCKTHGEFGPDGPIAEHNNEECLGAPVACNPCDEQGPS